MRARMQHREHEHCLWASVFRRTATEQVALKHVQTVRISVSGDGLGKRDRTLALT